MPAIGVYGGSFNPVHAAHVRLAVEMRERLGLDRVDLVPSSLPPHKPDTGLLPFALRLELLQLAVAGVEGLAVNDLEARRSGPSFTWDTLEAYRAAEPDAALTFILGANDLLTLPQWRRGLDLVELASLAVAPRGGVEEAAVEAFVAAQWGERATPAASPAHATRAWNFASGTRLLYVPAPCLDVSASQVRGLWRAGRSLACLLPPGVETALRSQRAVVDAAWP
ncbi:MAG: nicotinate (nicotinamide) nucleotide adenylyltransferase [Desulfovibrionaceae bacterium]